MSQWIIQDIINTILDGMHTPHLTETCDGVKTGDSTRPVKAIVTTFMATYAVIEKAAALDANFIITHEPTFYSHTDETDWLEKDPVYHAKRKLIDDNGIVIWRLHDHIHMRQPDGIILGLAQALGWEGCFDPQFPGICDIPPMTILHLTAHIKASLGIRSIRMVADPEMTCRRIALLVGAAGGPMHMDALTQAHADTILCGELQEWVASEYIRDANQQGGQKAILAIGHANSEEPGMRWLRDWLQPQFPQLSITHIPAEDPFIVV